MFSSLCFVISVLQLDIMSKPSHLCDKVILLCLSLHACLLCVWVLFVLVYLSVSVLIIDLSYQIATKRGQVGIVPFLTFAY